MALYTHIYIYMYNHHLRYKRPRPICRDEHMLCMYVYELQVVNVGDNLEASKKTKIPDAEVAVK